MTEGAAGYFGREEQRPRCAWRWSGRGRDSTRHAAAWRARRAVSIYGAWHASECHASPITRPFLSNGYHLISSVVCSAALQGRKGRAPIGNTSVRLAWLDTARHGSLATAEQCSPAPCLNAARLA